MQACSNDSNIENESGEYQPKIIIELERINKELLSTAPQGTKGWSNWNHEQKTKVILADLGGACGGAKSGLHFGLKAGLGIGAPHLVGGGFCALGALVGGAYASWMAAPTVAANDDLLKIQRVCKVIVKDDMSFNENSVILRSDDANDKINVSPILLKESKLDSTSLNVAQMHNIVLSTLDGSISLKDYLEDEHGETKYIDDMLNSQEFLDSCRIAGIRAQDLNVCSSNDLTAKIISLFNKVLEDYASKTDDVAFIIGKYMEVIESSFELTDDQKESIRFGLATALYSSNYWEKRYDELK